MNIAASSELVSRLSTHRRVVALGDTDFTDVAAVVITAADSRSGILTLLKRTGLLLLATGLRICGIKMFPVVNMLPALLLAMPLSAAWTAWFA